MRKTRTRAVAAALVAVVALAGCGAGEHTEAAGPPLDPALARALEAQLAGRIGEAETMYVDILRDRPQDKIALYNLGVIAHGRDDDVTATGLYRESLKADAAYPPALFNLALLCAEAGDRDEAAGLYRTLLRVEPVDSEAHLNYGFLLRDMGEREAGTDEMTKAIALDPRLGARANFTADVEPDGHS